ncbi:xenobiotic-transporting ATPase [Candidatus Omnitrophus magneticus]|uniref:Xenobiotic-transporting ATPase n=1 Tax=Candidatus Omnitrophus magneticus TaxID=1609969 RepID=A0A0F0CT01_9BACT|nr:xenobiotic-transporting ATPase [Candidatus Omnitrophus magneticus]
MKNYTRFLKFINPHLGIFFLAIICMILSTIFGASPIGMIIPLVDTIIAGKAISIPNGVILPPFAVDLIKHINAMPKIELLNIMAVGLLVMFFLKELFMFFQTYLMADVSQRIVRDIKNSIYKKLLDLSLDFYNHNPTGQLMSRITYDSTVIRDAISSGVADTFYQPIQMVIYLALLIGVKFYFNISWKLILIGTVILPLILYPVVKIGKKLRRISRESQEKVADINNMLLETISSIKLVKAFNMEEYETNRFKGKNQNFYKLDMKSIKRMKIVSPITEAMAVLCVTLIIWIAGKSILDGTLSAGAFAAFLAAIFSMMKPVKKLSSVYGINQQAMAAMERIFQILDTPITVKEKETVVPFNSFEKEITFNNVFFKYDNKKAHILKNISFTVKKGEIVALVGPSGSGKSTVVNLLPRFYDPGKGSIKIDGVDIRDVGLKSLREKIGMVTQETLLFNDSVRENISYGHEINEEQMIRVAKSANAHMFIRDFPEGYDTIIGERGLKISGGQRQRIAIARALYKNPPILILDEATSQLDTESEKLVQEAINKLMAGRTVIAIAHRLSTIIHADRIIVVDNGEIIDSGSHNELLERSTLYKKLYHMQFEIGASTIGDIV